MKFYNPFKPHIVKDGLGGYFVRVRELGRGWQFLSSCGYYFVGKYAAEGYSSFEEAQRKLDSHKCKIERERLYRERRNSFEVVHAPED